MKKATLVFASFMLVLSPVFAVDLVNTNLVGGDGIPPTNGINLTATSSISGSTITGGSATSTTLPTEIASAGGADGVNMSGSLIGSYTLSVAGSSILTGGNGGIVRIFGSPLSADAIASGGNGLFVSRADVSMIASSAIGGNGGSVRADNANNQEVDVAGGAGVTMITLPNKAKTLTLNSADITGGNGGSAKVVNAKTTSSANGGDGVSTLSSIGFAFAGSKSTISGGNGGSFDNGTGEAHADGGAGVSIKNNALSITISNANFFGGNGGIATGSATSTASGGSGILLTNSTDVTISGVESSGGSAGIVNGAAGSDGASLEIQESTVAISGSTLNGDLLFSGIGTTTFSITNTTLNGMTRQTSGIVNVNEWGDSHFQDTMVSDGAMNFTNRMFNLDGMFALGASSASANFNSGLTVRRGATLALGLGSVTGSSVLLRSGSQIETAFDGSNLGQINATDLTVNSGVHWTINTGSTTFTNGASFDLAVASGTLTNYMTANDVALVGTGGEFGWLGAISALTATNLTLTATYGASELDSALGVKGDTSSDFGRAMGALALSATNGTMAYAYMRDNYSSDEAFRPVATNSFLRTAEVASTLVGLQSLFVDQIKDRVRSQLQYDEVGYPDSPAPMGASGWDAMRDWSDRMESKVNTDSLRNFSDRMEEKFGYEQVKGLVDAVVPDVDVSETDIPPNWQAWGRGYGSHVEQNSKNGFAGYKASIGGAMLGIDKCMGNMLVGFGAGYTRTELDGDAGHDAQADTGHGIAYMSTHGDNLYIDLSASYALNAVETTDRELKYRGDYDAHTLGFYVGGGYAIPLYKQVVLTPEASILNTLYVRDSYVERSSLLGFSDKEFDSYDEWSHLMQLGATLATVQQFDVASFEVVCRPEVRAHWLHEFNDQMDAETYTMNNVSDLSASLMAREEDLIKVGAGLSFSKWADDDTEASIDIDGIYGNDGYDAYIVSGKITHRF